MPPHRLRPSALAGLVRPRRDARLSRVRRHARRSATPTRAWSASARSRSRYDFGAVTARRHRDRSAIIWRYAPLLPVPADVATRKNLSPGMTKLVKADNLAARARHEDAVGQGRHRQPDALVQGPRRRRRAVGGAQLRLHHRRLRLHRQPGRRGRRRRRPRRAALLRLHPARPGGGQARHDRGLRRHARRHRRQLRRRQPALLGGRRRPSGWGFVNVNLRPYYAEGSKTVGYEIAEQLGWRLPRQVVVADRVRLADDQDRQGVPRAGQARAGRGHPPYQSSAPRPPGCSPVQRGMDGRPRRRPAGAARTPSPSRWRSATRPTARTPSTSRGAPAAPSRTSPTTRSSTASSCSPRPRASSPRPPAASPSATLRKLLDAGLLDPDAETVILNTGDGLKTLDAVAPVASPTVDHRPAVRRVPCLRRREGPRVSVSVRIPTILRPYTGGAVRGGRRGRHPRRGDRRPRGGPPGHRGPRPGRRRRASAASSTSTSTTTTSASPRVWRRPLPTAPSISIIPAVAGG